MKISVVGMGKIGLPAAVQYATKGYEVVGADVNPTVVDLVNSGKIPAGIEGITDEFAAVSSAGNLRATTDTAEAVRTTDVTVVIVPVGAPGGVPDYRHMDAAVAAVAEGLTPGHLVVFETTLAVGDTRNRFVPVLESTGLQLGRDLFVAFSPERVQSHRVLLDLRRYPKIVGGVDDESTKRAVAFYESVLDAPVMAVRNSETAELTKLAESIYRDVNIALANELARYAHGVGVDIGEVIEAANSEPLSNVHQPGVGVGGHCIPVYPYFLLASRPDLQMTALARSINDGMPGWAVGEVGATLGGIEGKRVLVLGLSYRANLAEITGSVGLALIRELTAAGAVPVVADSFFTPEQIREAGAEPFVEADIAGIDGVIIQALHDEFQSFPWANLRKGTVVLDGRNALDAPSLQSLGLRYIGVGRRFDSQS